MSYDPTTMPRTNPDMSYETVLAACYETDEGETFVVTDLGVRGDYKWVKLEHILGHQDPRILSLSDFEDMVHGCYYSYVGMNW